MTRSSSCDIVEVTVGQSPVHEIYGNCRTWTSICDIGEVTVGQGPVLVI